MYNGASLSPEMMSALGGSSPVSFSDYAGQIRSILDQRREEHMRPDWRTRAMNSLGGNGANANIPGQAQPQPGVPPTLPPQAGVPQHNPVFGQPIPANMIGTSYGIPGMTPGSTGFDLPRY